MCINAALKENDTPIREIPGPGLHKIYHAVFGPNNETIYTCNEDGTIRVYDTEVRLSFS